MQVSGQVKSMGSQGHIMVCTNVNKPYFNKQNRTKNLTRVLTVKRIKSGSAYAMPSSSFDFRFQTSKRATPNTRKEKSHIIQGEEMTDCMGPLGTYIQHTRIHSMHTRSD